MTFELAPEAEAELEDARDSYEAAREGLGQRFVDEMHALALKVVAMPERFPLVKGTSVRRALGKRFPYMLIFKVRGGVVRVLAVAHQRRAPAYWTDRS